jgi:hypothetical protein
MLVVVAGFAASRLSILPVIKGLQVHNLVGGRVEFFDTRIVVTRIYGGGIIRFSGGSNAYQRVVPILECCGLT